MNPDSPESKLSLRERNRQRTKQRIIAAALELFRSQGYDQTTMDEIAEKASVSRATLFNYFPTKGSLFLPFATEIFQTKIQHDLEAYLRSNHGTIEVLRFFFMNIHAHLLMMPGIEQALKHEFLRPKEIDPQSLADDGGFLKILVEILAYGQEKGDVRQDMPLETLARFVGTLYLSIFFTVILQIEAADYATEIDKMLSFIYSGIHHPST